MRRTVALLLGLMVGLYAGPAAARLVCLVGIPPVAWLARGVGGDLVEVRVLVPPGRDPHSFTPTPRQVSRFARARAYFSLEMPFERRLSARLRGLNPRLEVIDVSHGIRRIPLPCGLEAGRVPGLYRSRDEMRGPRPRTWGKGAFSLRAQQRTTAPRRTLRGEPDPHLWLSPRLAARIAANLARALERLDPDHASRYQARLARLAGELEELGRELGRVLAPCRGRVMLVQHPAFGYLARDYGLRQVALECEGKEPGPRRMARLIELAKEQEVRVVFTEPGHPARGAQALARAVGGRVVELDPLAADYPAGLRRLARALARGLCGEAGP